MPSRVMAVATARTGLGQRTAIVPIRRQPLVFMARFGSSSPRRLATTKIAGAAVSDAAITTSRAIADGYASDLK